MKILILIPETIYNINIEMILSINRPNMNKKAKVVGKRNMQKKQGKKIGKFCDTDNAILYINI